MRRITECALRWAALGCLLYVPSPACAQSNPIITSLAWSADNAYIATGTVSGVATGWNVKTGQIAWTWKGPVENIKSISFDTARHAFLIVERPAQVILLDETSGALELNLTIDLPERDGKFRSALEIAAYDDESGILALVGQIEPSIHLMDLHKITGPEKAQTVSLGSWIYWLHPPAMGKTEDSSLVMSVARPTVSAADLNTLLFAAGGTHPADIALCDHAKIVLSMSTDGWFTQWDRSTGHSTATYNRHLEPPFEPPPEDGAPHFPHVSHLACDGRIAITTGTTKKYGAIQLWALSTGVLIDVPKSDREDYLYHDAYAIAMSSDSRFAVTDGEVRFRVWEVSDSKLGFEKMIFHTSGGFPFLTRNLAFAKGTHLLAVADDEFVSVVDIDKGTVKCFGIDCRPVTIKP